MPNRRQFFTCMLGLPMAAVAASPAPARQFGLTPHEQASVRVLWDYAEIRADIERQAIKDFAAIIGDPNEMMATRVAAAKALLRRGWHVLAFDQELRARLTGTASEPRSESPSESLWGKRHESTA